MATPVAKFKRGDKVSHVADPKNVFPAGTGEIVAVNPLGSGTGFSYKVKCDKTGIVIETDFKEAELSAL